MDLILLVRSFTSFIWLTLFTIKVNIIVAAAILPFYRFRFFRALILGSRPTLKEQIIIGSGAGLFNYFVSHFILQVDAVPYIPLLAGYYSGYLAGLIAGLLTASSVLHWNVTALFLFVAQGVIGFYIKRHQRFWKNSLLPLILTGSIISAVIWIFSPASGVKEPNLYQLTSYSLISVIIHQIVALSFVLYWFCRLLEYLAASEERQRAKLSAKILQMSQQALELLQKPQEKDTYLSLCRIVADMLETPCAIAILPDGRIISSHTDLYEHLFLETAMPKAVHDIFKKEVPYYSVNHCRLFNCIKPCSLEECLLFPVHDGEEVHVVMGTFTSRKQEFSRDLQSVIRQLSNLLSFEFMTRRMEQQKLLIEETKHQFLKAQIQPHFLFNALSTITSLISSEPNQAATLIKKLSKFLLQSFTKQCKFIPLKEDLEFLEAYLAIEKARFGNRLHIEFDINDTVRKELIPPMLIQPLVENAIKHGTSKKPKGGSVFIKICPAGKEIYFEVRDDGVGIQKSEKNLNRDSKGVGLSNVRERILSFAGKNNRFTISSNTDEGTSISFYLPRIDRKYD